MLSRMKIGAKLICGFMLVAAIAIVIGVVGISKMRQIDNAGTFLFEKAATPLGDLARISMNFGIVLRDLRDLVREKNMAKQEEIITEIETCRSEITKASDHYKTTLVDETDRKLFDDFLAARKDIGEDIGRLYNFVRADKDSAAYALLDSEVRRSSLAEDDVIGKMISTNVDAAKNISDKNNVTANSASLLLILVMIFGVVIAVVIGLALTFSITKPLNQNVVTMAEMAKGNLLVNFDQHALAVADETGILTRGMKDLTEQLKSTITFAIEASENVSTGSEQLSSMSQSISQGSSEQASSVEEISASIEEMTASIKQNADNANQTEKIAMKSSTDAKEGGEAVQKTVAAMKQIAEKISIIQEIARQTNLLSLNASIEAARAGEHGKGFAVVASAVQKLAERSQDAAEEISKLSKTSVDVAEKAGEMLNKLVPDIQKTAELVAEINAASAEQNKGIQQVNTAVQQFNQVVQSNASASEELASTSEELSSQAVELKNRLDFFKVETGQQHRNQSAGPQRRNQVNPHQQKLSIKAVNKEKQPGGMEGDGHAIAQKSGITLNMGDDEDNEFQRI